MAEDEKAGKWQAFRKGLFFGINGVSYGLVPILWGCLIAQLLYEHKRYSAAIILAIAVMTQILRIRLEWMEAKYRDKQHALEIAEINAHVKDSMLEGLRVVFGGLEKAGGVKMEVREATVEDMMKNLPDGGKWDS